MRPITGIAYWTTLAVVVSNAHPSLAAPAPPTDGAEEPPEEAPGAAPPAPPPVRDEGREGDPKTEGEPVQPGEDAPRAPTSEDPIAPGTVEPGSESESGAAVDPATEASGPASESGTTESDAIVSTEGAGLFEQSLAGADTSGDAGASEVASPKSYELNGYVRADAFVGRTPGADTAEMKAGYGELALKLNVNREKYGDAYAEARLRYGLEGDRRDLLMDLREAYVNAYLGALDLRFGHQIIVWGRADGFNPTNNLTPFDLRVRSPVEDDRRLGNFGLRTFLNLQPIRLEGVWLPVYRPVEIPAVQFPEFVTAGASDFPSPELQNSLVAGKVHLELSAFEASVSYLYGYAPLPGLALEGFTAGVTPPEIRVARTAYDHHVVGFDFSTAIGEFMAVRGEAAYRQPLHYEDRIYAPRPDVQYVLGGDKTFGPVSVIAQYIGRYVLDWQRETGPEDPVSPTALSGFTPPLPEFLEDTINESINGELAVRNQTLFSQTEELQHMASLRVEWLTLHDTLSLSALGLLNVTTEEWLLYPKLQYQLSDRMSASLGAEVYMGPDGTLLGLIDEELSAGYTELRFSF